MHVHVLSSECNHMITAVDMHCDISTNPFDNIVTQAVR